MSVIRVRATVDIHCSGESDGTAHVEDDVQAVEAGGNVEEWLFEHRWPDYRWEKVAGGDESEDADEHGVVDLTRIAWAARDLVPV